VLGGDFTWEEESDEPVVMVAGGIGATAFCSILLERHKVGNHLISRYEEVSFQTEPQNISKSTALFDRGVFSNSFRH
jgi:ferredoxin-NADP reductase